MNWTPVFRRWRIRSGVPSAYLLTFFARIMLNPAFDTAGTALFMTDRNGKIVMSNPLAARLLALADNEPSSLPELADASLPPWLEPILDGARSRHSALEVPASAIERNNASGRFVFRAYRLHSVQQQSQPALFAISIEHRPPAAEAIAAAAARLGLSERQQRVCVEMINRASYAEIARMLGIKESTVVDHVRRIYEKLDVHSRDELNKKLL
jgi:DNA-binding CsgD family transcriptional regulator